MASASLLFDSRPDQQLASRSIGVLFVSRAGDLLIGYSLSGSSLCRAVDAYACHSIRGMPTGEAIEDFRQDAEGTLWVEGDAGDYVLQDGAWRSANASWGLPLDKPAALTFDRSGNRWAVSGNGVYLARKSARRFDLTAIKLPPGARRLRLVPDGTLWTHGNDGYAQLRAKDAPSPPATIDDQNWRASTPILIDRNGGIWSVACNNESICRHGSTQNRLAPLTDADLSNDQFTPADGLSSTGAMTLLEDREGDVWVGTKRGLDRFRPNTVMAVSLPGSPLYFAMNPDPNGGIWVGTATNSDTPDHWWQLDPSPTMLPGFTGDTTATFRQADSSIVTGGEEGLHLFRHGKFESMDGPAGEKGKRVQVIARDGGGHLWIGFQHSTIYRQDGKAWVKKGNLPTLPDETPAVATADAHGRLWLGYPDNRVVIIDQQTIQQFTAAQGLGTGSVTAIFLDGTPLIGGEFGLAAFDGKRFHPLLAERTDALTGITGILRTADGTLWLNGFAGAVRVTAADLDHALKDPAFRMPVEVFDAQDGMPGSAQQIRPLPTTALGNDGKIWFAATNGLAWIDPMHTDRHHAPPRVVVGLVEAGGKTYEATQGLRLPALTRSLRIAYSGLNVSIPERTEFRYRLYGTNDGWEDAGSRREATYTNLNPGKYHFRVMARNGNGPWGSIDKDFAFSIAPAFYQTLWFRCAVCFVLAFCLLVLHRLRLRQMARSIRGILGERLRERERIARELHDTLIQDFQSLILHMDALSKSPHEDVLDRKESFDALTDMAQRALIDGRDRVTELRAHIDDRTDMAAALQLDAQAFQYLRNIEIGVVVAGVPRDLYTVACEEIHAIGKEALLNAFKHSNATKITIHLAYSSRRFSLRIKDNGKGISDVTSRQTSDRAHFGLIGMKERAAKLHASLAFLPLSPHGTEVSLHVSGSVAYASQRRAWKRWVGKILNRAKNKVATPPA